jgi:hypothetical protein
MIRRVLIGPALTGAGWLTGSYYGASVQQVVHKSPDTTYLAFSHALDDLPQSGMTAMEGGKPVPYEISIDRTLDRQLVVHILFDGREGATTEIDFAPVDEGETATLVTAKAQKDHAVLAAALAGTSRARIAYAPDWMLNMLTVRPLLANMAEQIDKGEQPQLGG